MAWAAVGGAAVGAAGSMIGGSKAGKKAASAQKAADLAQKEAAAYQQMWGQQNRDAANAMNRENTSWVNDLNQQNAQNANAMTQGNMGWVNQQNQQNALINNDMTRGNMDWANQQNQANAATTNDMTRGNMEWANQQNLANAATANEMNRGNVDYSNALNRENQDYAMNQNWASQLRGQEINKQALQDQTDSNRLNSTNAFGGTLSFNPDGSVNQTLGKGDQHLMDTYNSKSNDIMSGFGNGFDVNGDVMNAYKAINQPMVDQQRDKENARLAAMGLATGSGNAWGNAQDALNRNQVNSDQNAILQGFQADQALRQSNRADLGALGGVRSSIQQGLAQPDYWKQSNAATVSSPQEQAVNAATVNTNIANTQGWNASPIASVQGWNNPIANVQGWTAPFAQASVPGVSANNAPSYDPMASLNYGQASGQATQNQWNSLGNAAGQATSQILGGKNNNASPTLAQQGAADFTNGWNASNYG